MREVRVSELIRCARCALPETYPGIVIDQRGICNYCHHFDRERERQNISREAMGREFLSLIEEEKRSQRTYDGILCYSGGKDSSFLLHHLTTSMGLRILALHLDNYFQSPAAARNVYQVTERLAVDLMVIRPRTDFLRSLFTNMLVKPSSYPKELLAMMSPLCTACQGMILGVALKTALEKGIPLVFTGYTPAQYPYVSLENFRKARSCIYFSSSVSKDDPVDMIHVIRDPIEEVFGSIVEAYYFESQYIREGQPNPKVIFPFHSLVEYDEREIYRVLERIGWKRPLDTDLCSTNCLINALGNYGSLKQFGFHPYSGEMSFLVRDGRKSFSEAVEAERIDSGDIALTISLERLGISEEDVCGPWEVR